LLSTKIISSGIKQAVQFAIELTEIETCWACAPFPTGTFEKHFDKRYLAQSLVDHKLNS